MYKEKGEVILKIGIIGFGKMGMLHGALLNSINGVEIIAITDTSKLLLSAFKSVMPSVKYFIKYKEMIDTCKLDAVIIATPSFNHVEIAMYAAEKGLHLFIEKPLSFDYQSAKELTKYIKGKNIKSLVGFCLRYVPTFDKAKQIIDSGEIGRIENVSAKMFIADVLEEHNGWRYNKKISGGGVLIDFGVHMIDLLCWYFSNVKSVCAETKKLYSKEVEDEIYAEIVFENSIKAIFESSWSKPEYRKSYSRIEIEGETANMIVTDQTIDIIYKNKPSEKITYPDVYKGEYVDIGGINFSIQMRTFYELINDSTNTNIDIYQACYVQKIVDLLYKSAENNSILNLSEGENDDNR